MLNIDRTDANGENRMRVLAYDEFVLGYQLVLADGTSRECPGAQFAWTIWGPGIGAALGLDVDEVSAVSERKIIRGMTTFVMRHAPTVGPALAALGGGLRWKLAKLRAGGQDTRFEGLLVVPRAPAIAHVPPADNGTGAMFILIDRRP